MANPEHLAKLLEGVKAWNQWKKEDTVISTNLDETDLSETNLSGANLHGADRSDIDELFEPDFEDDYDEVYYFEDNRTICDICEGSITEDGSCYRCGYPDSYPSGN